jgi:hypothetical protein
LYWLLHNSWCFPEPHPELWRVERAMTVVSWGIDVVEVIPDCSFVSTYSCTHQYDCQRSNSPCPMITPQISSFGTLPCTAKLKAISTQGSHGALNTSSPRKLSNVSGLRRLQMYTSIELRGEPRKAMLKKGAMQRRHVAAKVRR